MKRICISAALVCGMVCTALVSCGSSGKNTAPVEQPVIEIQQIEIPDLPQNGLARADFTQSDEPYTPKYFGADWIYDESEKPQLSWTEYRSEAGASIVFDEYGRFRKFTNDTRLLYNTDVETVLSADELNAAAREMLPLFCRDMAGFEETYVMNQDVNGMSYPCEIYLERKITEQIKDSLMISLNADGTIRTASAEYCDLAAGTDLNAIDRAFANYIQTYKSNLSEGRVISGETAELYQQIAGTAYGMYEFYIETPTGNPSEFTSTKKTVLIRAS